MSDMDRIGPLDLLAQLNIIDGFDGLIHQATGDWVRLEWERQPGALTGGEIEKKLRERGVKIVGRGSALPSEEHPHGTLVCFARGSQARWAEYVMTTYGVPFTMEPIDAKSVAAAQRRQGTPIPAWSERGQLGPSITLSGMQFPTQREEEKGPVRRVLDWLRDGWGER